MNPRQVDAIVDPPPAAINAIVPDAVFPPPLDAVQAFVPPPPDAINAIMPAPPDAIPAVVTDAIPPSPDAIQALPAQEDALPPPEVEPCSRARDLSRRPCSAIAWGGTPARLAFNNGLYRVNPEPAGVCAMVPPPLINLK